MSKSSKITRRDAIHILGAAGALALVGCGGAAASSTAGGTTTTTGSGSSAACVLTPELTVGPYFVDEKLNRSDLTTDTSNPNVVNAIPLTLAITVLAYTASGCSALQNAQVDIWHADAGGVYSDESVEGTSGQTYLRGYQLTDANGLATFKTVFPGWYSGRTVHIHVMIRTYSSSGSQATEFTTQLFFDPTLTLQVMALSPYSTRGNPDTTNSNDNIYNSATLLSLASASSGYTTAITLGVQV